MSFVIPRSFRALYGRCFLLACPWQDSVNTELGGLAGVPGQGQSLMLRPDVLQDWFPAWSPAVCGFSGGHTYLTQPGSPLGYFRISASAGRGRGKQATGCIMAKRKKK